MTPLLVRSSIRAIRSRLIEPFDRDVGRPDVEEGVQWGSKGAPAENGDH